MTPTRSDQAFDILVCGFAIHRIDPRRPYGALRGNAMRALGLANNLALQGWRTGLVVEPGCEAPPSDLVSPALRLVARPDLPSAASRSRVLVLACTNLKTLNQNVPEALSLDHPRTWVASCFDQNADFDVAPLASRLVGVSFNNSQQAESWTLRGLGTPVHVVPFGVDEHPYVDEAIVPAATATAVWIGALRHPVLLRRIVGFAEVNPECDVLVVSGLAFNQELPREAEGSLARPYIDEYREAPPPGRFEQLVLEWCGRPAPRNLHYLGARPGENADLLGRATVALGFSRRPNQTHDDSKILDYLRSGVPVLCDDGQPSHRFVLETGHGFLIPFDAHAGALRDGFLKCQSVSDTERRRTVAATIRERYGWPAVARQVAAWIEADVAAAAADAGRRLTAAYRAWPELQRHAATLYYEADALAAPRFERQHVMEVVDRARRREPRASLFYLTDTAIDPHEPDVLRLHHPEEAIGVAGPKVFICAFESDEKLALALEQIHSLPDAIYLMPRVFVPTARYFHRSDVAMEVLRAEAALPEPKYSLADFENLIQALESTRNVPGDFVEVGVYRGRSAHCALSYMRCAGISRRAWLLDVFEGFTYPEAAASSDAYWAGSHADASETGVRRWLQEFPHVTVLKANIIRDPLPAELSTIAVANIDVDLHEAVAAALARLVPLTVPGSILILEDQGHTPPLGGAWLAVRQFLDSPASADFTPVHMGSGQMFLVRHAAPSPVGHRPALPEARPTRRSRAMPLRLLYVPWIEGHTGALVRLLEAAGDVEFAPLPLSDLVPEGSPLHRSQVMRLAEQDPAEFHRRLEGLVRRTPGEANALLLTADWCAGLRDTARAFRRSGFPTVLVPHESVFAHEEAYYRDPVTGIDLPQAEVAMLWGGLQHEIFSRRGLSRDRMRVLGSPKLDAVKAHRSPVGRDEFYARWQLSADRPVCLFATQPLDNQPDTREAQRAQSRAVADILRFCHRRGCQLLVRLPPARGVEILDPDVVADLVGSGLAALDGAQEGRVLAGALDALYHADIVASINSTMLLEASLMGRPAVSFGYAPSEQLWHKKGGLPLVASEGDVDGTLSDALEAGTSLLSEEGDRWVRWAFSPGTFDGRSARRILDCIGARWPERIPIRTAVTG